MMTINQSVYNGFFFFTQIDGFVIYSVLYIFLHEVVYYFERTCSLSKGPITTNEDLMVLKPQSNIILTNYIAQIF